MAIGFVLTHMPLTMPQKEFLNQWDKSLHFILFSGMAIGIAVVVSRFVKTTSIRIAMTITVGLGVAVIDESLQFFIPDRNMDFIDMVSNCVGVLAGVAIHEMGRLGCKWIKRRQPAVQ